MDTGKSVSRLAIHTTDELIFGYALHPVTCGNNLTIGNGLVYPEINFTLPPMPIRSETWVDVRRQYEEIAESVITRAEKLKLPGLVVEFEELPPMTEKPEWGAEITQLLKGKLNQLFERTGMPNALRVTVVDLRDAECPNLL